MRQEFLPFSVPSIDKDEIREVVDTLRSGWLTTGPKARRFEEDFATYVGAPAALALSSCTGALHVALASLGVGPGDQVVTTAMTFCSSAHVIEQVGAQPVLVDVEPDTLNIDPVAVQGIVAKGQGRVKAILPVHLYGHPCDMEPLLEVARGHNLFVIEDAAHAVPARYKGNMIGTLGTLTAFSFYATKNLTTAEGGMLTGSVDLIEHARAWGLHGMSRDAWKRYTSAGSWYYEVIVPGFKYNMTDIQASLGLHQLRKLDQFQVLRRRLVARYETGLAGLDSVQLPIERPDVESAWHLYILRLNLDTLRIDRAQFIEELKARNIGTSVHFIPIHMHPYYRDKYEFTPDAFPVAFREYQRIISLPLYPQMTEGDVDDVVDAVRDVSATFRR